jgi:hypothetical protein
MGDEVSSGSDPTESTHISLATNTSPTRRRETSSLGWQYFAVDFHSSVGDKMHQLTELERVCSPFAHKLIDLRPYVESKPYTCFRKDSYQKVLSIFRMMNCRQMPVLDEKRNCALVGIITR